jgi:hypothetical protein
MQRTTARNTPELPPALGARNSSPPPPFPTHHTAGWCSNPDLIRALSAYIAVRREGIDPEEAVQASADAAGLCTLALRHGIHHARRDVMPRPPYAAGSD